MKKGREKFYFIGNWITRITLLDAILALNARAKWWYSPSKRRVAIDPYTCCTGAMYDERDDPASSAVLAAARYRRSLGSPGCSLNYLLSFQHLQNCIAGFGSCTLQNATRDFVHLSERSSLQQRYRPVSLTLDLVTLRAPNRRDVWLLSRCIALYYFYYSYEIFLS